MKKSHLMSAVCAGVVTLLASVTANASIVYNLNRTIGAGTVTGFIETDGTIGVLTSANITDWFLTLTAPNLNGGSPDVIDRANSVNPAFLGSALTGSSTALTFNVDAVGTNLLFLQGSSPNNYWCIETTGCSAGGFPGETIGWDATTGDPTYTEIALRSGTIEFAVAAVPVPAAVWLFGFGLLGLIGIARRKKT